MIGPLIHGLRPKQWTKNLLVFAGVVFAQLATQPTMMLRAVAGFVAFSLLASTVYLVNDLKDVEADRQHPKKRHRALASGRLSPAVAWAAVPVLLLAAGALAWWLGAAFAIVLGIYLVSNVAYSFGLKHVVILDIFLIATGFVLRAVAGVELLRPVVENIPVSSWLLVCTFFGALFLAASKRRRELVNAGASAASQREVLGDYTPELLDRMLTVSASTTLMAYALYTIWPTTVSRVGNEGLIVTVPVVAYGVFRYLHLVRVSETSEDPSQVLLSDRPIQATVVLFVVLAVSILYLGR